ARGDPGVQRGHRAGIPDVHRDREARLAELARHLGRAVGVDVRDRDGRAPGREPGRYRGPDALGRPGDDGRPSGKAVHDPSWACSLGSWKNGERWTNRADASSTSPTTTTPTIDHTCAAGAESSDFTTIQARKTAAASGRIPSMIAF